MTTVVWTTEEQLQKAKQDPGWPGCLRDAQHKIREATGETTQGWVEALAVLQTLERRAFRVRKSRRNTKPPSHSARLLGSSPAGYRVWVY